MLYHWATGDSTEHHYLLNFFNFQSISILAIRRSSWHETVKFSCLLCSWTKKLDYYFWNSIDAKTRFYFLKRWKYRHIAHFKQHYKKKDQITWLTIVIKETNKTLLAVTEIDVYSYWHHWKCVLIKKTAKNRLLPSSKSYDIIIMTRRRILSFYVPMGIRIRKTYSGSRRLLDRSQFYGI